MNLTSPYAPGALMVAAFALLPFGRMVELPLACLSFIGLWAIWEGLHRHEGLPWRALGFLYLAFLVPMLLALPDAVESGKSLRSSVGSLRFVLPCVALLWLLQTATDGERRQAASLRLLGVGTGLLLIFWNLDGLLQFLTGQNILGYQALEGERYINGVFGENDNVKFGLTVALLLPIGLVHSLRHWPPAASLVFLLLALALIVLSGKRAAWIVAVVELASLLMYYRWRGSLPTRRLVVSVIAAVVALGLVYSSSDWVQSRSKVLVVALDEPDYANLNAATGKRLPIWRTAVAMGSANWLNGVGPRGFRFAYADYAEAGDFWAQPLENGRGSRGVHAHQLVLDLQSETGLIGVLGYLAMLMVLGRCWLSASENARSRALPYAVALVGMLFPINTHPAWYSSWYGQLLWAFIGMYLFAISEPRAAVAKP